MAGTQAQMGFGGRRPTTSIINAHSSGGTSAASVGPSAASSARAVLSGALTAATLAPLLTVTNGGGEVSLLSLSTVDGTTRTARLKVTVDGVVVFDATSTAISTGTAGIYAAGAKNGSMLMPARPIVFLRSLNVEVASSLTETDKLTLCYLMHRDR